MIEIFGIQLSQLPELHRIVSLLDPRFYEGWKKTHLRMREELACRASLGALLLLQMAGVKGHLCYDENRRPFLAEGGLDFSITHTVHHAFCAIEREESIGESSPRVGIDAENFSRVSGIRICPMAARWFTKEEHEAFLVHPTEDHFLRVWTKKEALVKWTGEGLLGLQRADTLQAEQVLGVRFREYRVEDAYVALCCREGAVPPNEIRMIPDSEIAKLLC